MLLGLPLTKKRTGGLEKGQRKKKFEGLVGTSISLSSFPMSS
jgi:hypothetical protein